MQKQIKLSEYAKRRSKRVIKKMIEELKEDGR